MSCIRPQILSDEQQSTEIVLIEKMYHDNFGVQTFQNDSSLSYTFCSTHNSRIKSEVSAFIFYRFKTKEIMDTVKDAVNTLLGRKPTGPKVRYGIVAAGWITQAAFIPGVGQTSNSSMRNLSLFFYTRKSICRQFFLLFLWKDRYIAVPVRNFSIRVQ